MRVGDDRVAVSVWGTGLRTGIEPEDTAGSFGEFGQACPVHLVVHERSPALSKHEARLSEHLEVVRNGWLTERKMRDDIADADGLSMLGEEIEDADPRRICQRPEPSRVFLGLLLINLRGIYRRAA